MINLKIYNQYFNNTINIIRSIQIVVNKRIDKMLKKLNYFVRNTLKIINK